MARRASTTLAHSGAEPAIYDDLRSRILHVEGSYTLVALADGTTSLYLSSGGGTIGGGEHPRVAEAARRLVEAAQEQLPVFRPAEGQDLPPVGQTVVRLLTFAGPRALQAAEADLGEGRHPQSGLFFKAQDVITELRLISEGR